MEEEENARLDFGSVKAPKGFGYGGGSNQPPLPYSTNGSTQQYSGNQIQNGMRNHNLHIVTNNVPFSGNLQQGRSNGNYSGKYPDQPISDVYNGNYSSGPGYYGQEQNYQAPESYSYGPRDNKHLDYAEYYMNSPEDLHYNKV
jgi:hypothetical protein